MAIKVIVELQAKPVVGWVEARDPTILGLCWVSLRSTQPTTT